MLAPEMRHEGRFGTVPSLAALDFAGVVFDAETEILRFLLGIELLIQALPDQGLQILAKTRFELSTLLP